jgi:8-oxo-dGTP pyrophosphatase MutT (NUDIX family)
MAARKFKPKPGQLDYTHARFAPSLNCVVQYRGKILIVRRSRNMRLYPGYWNGIGGFLDDEKTLEQKTKEELKEELGIRSKDIISLKFGRVFDLVEPRYKKVWLIYPVLAKIKNDKIKLDWEAEEYRWIKLEEAKKFKLAPGFQKVLQQLFLVSDGRQIQEKP